MEAEELQKRREALGLDREELAKALRTTQVTIWRWENGQRKIPPYLDLALDAVEHADVIKRAKARKQNPKK